MNYVTQWWSEFSNGVINFVVYGGPTEMVIVTGVATAFGVMCMRGFQIR